MQTLLDRYTEDARDVSVVLADIWTAPDVLRNLLQHAAWRKQMGKDPCIAIDWYTFNEKWKGLQNLHFRTLARIVRPLEIRREADPILRQIVASNDPGIVAFAIEHGFITARNAPFLCRLPGVGREVTELLLDLGDDESLEKQYEL